MAVTEILYRARPVDARHEAIEPEAGAPHQLGRVEVESVFYRSLRTDAIDMVQQEHAGSHRNAEAGAGDEGGALRRGHRSEPREIISNSCVRRSGRHH